MTTTALYDYSLWWYCTELLRHFAGLRCVVWFYPSPHWVSGICSRARRLILHLHELFADPKSSNQLWSLSLYSCNLEIRNKSHIFRHISISLQKWKYAQPFITGLKTAPFYQDRRARIKESLTFILTPPGLVPEMWTKMKIVSPGFGVFR